MRDKIDSEALKCVADADVRLNQMFRPYALKMEAAGLHPIVINMFKCYYGQLVYDVCGHHHHDVDAMVECAGLADASW